MNETLTLSVKYNSIDDVVIRYAGKTVLVSFFCQF